MLKRIAVSIAGALTLCACGQPDEGSNAATGIRFLSQVRDAQAFDVADSVRQFEFPRDHGIHPGFATEWWYFTGNLQATSGRHFGFELTFFRYALSAAAIERASAWGSNQVWLAHFTVTDTLNERFFSAERMGRGALGIAGALDDTLDVHVRDWSARSRDDGATIQLDASTAETAISLTLDDPAPIALHGEQGLDRKGAGPGNASYYYSIARMAAAGSVRLPGGEVLEVSGSAWMDREWATSSLEEGVEGWDWFSLQLDDDTNLMLYRLRNADGSMNEFSTATLMQSDGSTMQLPANAVRYEIVDTWRSPQSGVTYPIRWRIEIAQLELELQIDAVIPNQEFNLGLRYWEGAVRAAGTSRGRDVAGVGYLELAGYR